MRIQARSPLREQANTDSTSAVLIVGNVGCVPMVVGVVSKEEPLPGIEIGCVTLTSLYRHSGESQNPRSCL